MDIQQIIELANNIQKNQNTCELIENIKKFRESNISTISYEELNEKVLNVFGTFAYITNLSKYKKGTKFYRIKTLEGSNIPNSRFSKYSDYWETNPTYITKCGRINKPGESLIYTSLDYICCIKELQIKPGEPFVVIRYSAKEDVKVNVIGGTYDYNALGITDEKQITNNEIVNDFLRNEFSREVGEGNEYLYRLSESIAKNFFDLPPRDVQDAWCYLSVKDKTKYNVCFRPNIAREVLEVDGAMVCSNYHDNFLEVKLISDGKDQNEKIRFYPIGSTKQLEVFPEISNISKQ